MHFDAMRSREPLTAANILAFVHIVRGPLQESSHIFACAPRDAFQGKKQGSGNPSEKRGAISRAHRRKVHAASAHLRVCIASPKFLGSVGVATWMSSMHTWTPMPCAARRSACAASFKAPHMDVY